MKSTNGCVPESASEELLRDAQEREERWELTLAAFDKLEAEYRANPTETITLLREGFEAVRKAGL